MPRRSRSCSAPSPACRAFSIPVPAEGGSDAEALTSFRDRATASVRHRGRALAAPDYEAMVREASSAVAVVKAISCRNPVGRTLPGWLTIFIIPESESPRPYPTRGMRDEVLAYIAQHAPAPDWWPVVASTLPAPLISPWISPPSLLLWWSRKLAQWKQRPFRRLRDGFPASAPWRAHGRGLGFWPKCLSLGRGNGA